MSSKQEPSKGIMGVFSKLSKWLYNFEVAFMVIFTMYVAIDVVIAIVLRALGIQGVPFSEELGRVMLITTTMVGSSMAVKDEGHVTMDTLYQYISKHATQCIKTVVFLFCGVFWLLMSRYGFEFTIKLFQMNKTWESIRLPKGLIWLVVTLAMFTMGVRYLIQTVLSIQKIKNRTYEINDGTDITDATGGER